MINYLNLHNSSLHYEKYDFLRIETPWTVSKEIDNLTKPIDRISYELKHNDKCLVASGEQSFLYLYLKNFLPKGKFQTITPCFRDESFDFLHAKYFMKNELIQTDKVNKFELEKIIQIVLKFHMKFFKYDDLKIIKTNIGYDLEIHNKELGSFGIRENNFLKYIYATGCAEPRLSNLIKLYGISSKRNT